MPDLPDVDYEGQDSAEMFDEDNQLPDGARMKGGDDGLTFEGMTDVLDVTRAVGDEDDDEALIGDDLDDDEIVQLATDNDDDDDDAENDDLRSRDQEAFDDEEQLDNEADVGDEDDDDVDAIDAQDAEEVEMTYAGDLNDQQGALSSAKRFESSRVSDEELDKLGYSKGGLKAEGEGKTFDPDGQQVPHSHDDDAPEALSESHPDHPMKQDERLDEGIEESFPASDPVSVKHIT